MVAGAIYLPIWVVPAAAEVALAIYYVVDGYRRRSRRDAERARRRRRRVYEDQAAGKVFFP